MQLTEPDTLSTEHRKDCLILGIDPERMTEPLIRAAWKRQVSAMAYIGDKESAVKLKEAKDALISLLRSRDAKYMTPKQPLCEDWHWPHGPHPEDPDHPSGVPRRPLPTTGAGEIALPEPEYRVEG